MEESERWVRSEAGQKLERAVAERDKKDVEMESDEEWGGGFKKAKVTVRKGLRRLVELAKTLPTTDEEEEESMETFTERVEARWETTGPGIQPLRSWLGPRVKGSLGRAEGWWNRKRVLTTEEWEEESEEDWKMRMVAKVQERYEREEIWGRWTRKSGRSGWGAQWRRSSGGTGSRRRGSHG